MTDTDSQTLQFLKEYLNDSTVYVEFGPGDCQLASTLCQYAKKVIAVDISDQRKDRSRLPSNFELIIYDGYDLNMKRNSVDVVFSDQFIEHLHPEDVEYHFQLVNRILRDKGLYIFRTPHAYFGPHDISKFFSDEPEGFHLKEWTHAEIEEILKKVNFTSWDGFWRINSKLNNKYLKIPFRYFKTAEAMLKGLPKKPQRKVSRLFLPLKVFMLAVK
jgi:SAM-dependent methyltransferase